MNWMGGRIQFLIIHLLSGWWVQIVSATATADTAGLEPAASHCIDIVVDTGALPLELCVLWFFSGLPAGESSQERTDALLLTTEVSGFQGRTNPDRQWRRNQAFLPPHWRQTCPLPPQLSQRYPRNCFPVPLHDGHVLVPVYPMWVHFIQDKGLTPFPPQLRRKKELTPFQVMLLCEAWAGFGVIRDTSPRS